VLREEELQRKLHPKLVHKPKKAGARNAKMAARAAASLRTAQHRAALAREAALRKEHLVHMPPAELKIRHLKQELLVAEHHESNLLKKEHQTQHTLAAVEKKEETGAGMHTRRAAFMRSLAAQAAWSKNYLHKVQTEKPLAKLLSGKSKAEAKAVAKGTAAAGAAGKW